MFDLFQPRYILKFSTDGAILSNIKSAVQGSMKLIPADREGRVLLNSSIPTYLKKEITLYYFIG